MPHLKPAPLRSLPPLTLLQVSSIEFSQIQAAVVHGLEQGSSVLKQLQQEVSLERVEKLMDSSAEAVAYQREIDEALMSAMSPEEEEDVQAQLAALEAEVMVSYRGVELGYLLSTDVPIRTALLCLRSRPAQDPRRARDSTHHAPRRANRGTHRTGAGTSTSSR